MDFALFDLFVLVLGLRLDYAAIDFLRNLLRERQRLFFVLEVIHRVILGFRFRPAG